MEEFGSEAFRVLFPKLPATPSVYLPRSPPDGHVRAAIWAGPTLRVRSQAASHASCPAPPSFRHHLSFLLVLCSSSRPSQPSSRGLWLQYAPLCLLDSTSPGSSTLGPEAPLGQSPADRAFPEEDVELGISATAGLSTIPLGRGISIPFLWQLR